MRPDDRIRLQHIIEAGEVIASFVDGADRADLDTDRKLLLALTRAIEIVGEAASRVSAGTRAALPTVPWAQIVAMRNRLIHAYFDIDRDILWRTAVEEIPALLTLLPPLLDDDRPDGPQQPDGQQQ